VQVAAFCDTCGAVFPSSVAVVDSGSAALAGSSAGPCPVCAGTGHIPDGVSDFVANTIEILSSPQLAEEQLRALGEILTEACGKRENPDQIVEKIGQLAPGLSGIADLVRNAGADLYSFLVLTVTVIALQSQARRSGDAGPAITVPHVIEHLFNETSKLASRTDWPRPRVGRNQPCPCGSGKRYKRCCGRLS
jgi:hypothetical protein